MLPNSLGVADAEAWRQGWRQRLQHLPFAAELDAQLLWGLALPMLRSIEHSLEQNPSQRPVVALTAPVGAGKSTLAAQVQALAAALGLSLAVASIDDAYRSWPEREQRLAGNPFGVTRVPPGSHDPALLQQAIQRWRSGDVLQLPRFDKTLRSGLGDRAGTMPLQADALLLEGWLVGYAPVGATALAHWLADPSREHDAVLRLSQEERAWLPHWDQELAAYQDLWACCDSFWVLQPSQWPSVLRWRLQAEARQRRRSGKALGAAAIRQMVRATLASLPPALYQPALLARASAVATLGRQRQCLAVTPNLEAAEADPDQQGL